MAATRLRISRLIAWMMQTVVGRLTVVQQCKQWINRVHYLLPVDVPMVDVQSAQLALSNRLASRHCHYLPRRGSHNADRR